MNIARIIRAYFLFVMTVVAMGSVTYTDYGQTYLNSVLSIDNAVSRTVSVLPSYSRLDRGKNMYDIFRSNSQQPSLLNLEISQDPENRFVTPGSENVDMMKFSFSAYDEMVVVKGLYLNIGEGDFDSIDRALLIDGDDFVSKGIRIDDKFIFKNINFQIDPGNTKEFHLVVNLSEDLVAGDRLRLDLQSARDLEALVGGKPYKFKQKFPIKGEYLTVVNKRLWDQSPAQ